MGPKELIIQTALEIIGQEGVQKITTREIAKRANVNSAALNYHFGSKENLIRQAMEFFIKTLNGAFALLEREELGAGERMLAFLKKFAEISVLYPGVTKSLVCQMMFVEADNPALTAAQKHGVAAFASILKQVAGIQEERMALRLGLQMMSSVIYPVLISRQLPALYGFNYADRQEREAYIEQLYRTYVPSPSG